MRDKGCATGCATDEITPNESVQRREPLLALTRRPRGNRDRLIRDVYSTPHVNKARLSTLPSVRSNLCGLWCGDRSAPPPPREQIADGAAGSDQQSEQQRRHMRYLFGPGCISGVDEQGHRTDAHHPHADHAARNTKGPHHLRLLDAQCDERCKLDHQAGAIQDQIDRDEPLVGESERRRPAEAA